MKQSIAKDKSVWLDALLGSGDWHQIRKLRKGFKPNQGRLRDSNGELVENNARAETLAIHLERVQWAVRFVTAMPDTSPIGTSLETDENPIFESEVIEAATRLKNSKASGDDGLPPEFWKAVAKYGTDTCKWALLLCQRCWDEGSVPDDWHQALVVTIFKKGDPSQCDNYRPISLLPIGYKLFALILLERLKRGGAEDRIWRTQFGFRSGCGANDALFLARRLIEKTWETRDGKLILLALDWAKAFDSISPDSLLMALQRFGIKGRLLDAVKAIYTDRIFRVRDSGSTSEFHKQEFGICQGCPLSPFLFTIVMTVLMHDAKQELSQNPIYVQPGPHHVEDLLYADDTLLIHAEVTVVQAFMSCVSTVGQQYGLSFNWSKLEVMPVRCACQVFTPSGEEVKQKTTLKYLGSLLCSDGRIGTELNHRLGNARADFNMLCKVWAHAGLSKKRKLEIYNACIVSKLMYCLSTAWLNKSDLRKLDAFHVRCLRRLSGIKPSFISRVSNVEVLSQLKCQLLSCTLLQQQLNYISNLARQRQGHVLRDFLFEPNSIILRPREGVRKRGRPRKSWARELHWQALQIAGGSQNNLASLWADTPVARQRWQQAVRAHCSTLPI